MKEGARLLLHRMTEKQLLRLSDAVNSAIEEKLRRPTEGGREFPLPANAVVIRVALVEEVPAGQRAR